MKRPPNLPASAVFNEADNEWELGERRGALCVGAWTWWRPDGTLLGETPFNDAGQPHGLVRRYHPSGECSLASPYRFGIAHGKQMMTRHTTGESAENPMFALQLKGVYRMDTLNVDGKPQGIATFYNREGLDAPVPHAADGVSVDLGAHLAKLMPNTAMAQVAPFLHTMTGKLPSSMVKLVYFVGLAVVDGSRYRLRVIDHKGAESMTIADASEISRALSLAVDYRAAQLMSA